MDLREARLTRGACASGGEASGEGDWGGARVRVWEPGHCQPPDWGQRRGEGTAQGTLWPMTLQMRRTLRLGQHVRRGSPRASGGREWWDWRTICPVPVPGTATHSGWSTDSASTSFGAAFRLLLLGWVRRWWCSISEEKQRRRRMKRSTWDCVEPHALHHHCHRDRYHPRVSSWGSLPPLPQRLDSCVPSSTKHGHLKAVCTHYLHPLFMSLHVVLTRQSPRGTTTTIEACPTSCFPLLPFPPCPKSVVDSIRWRMRRKMEESYLSMVVIWQSSSESFCLAPFSLIHVHYFASLRFGGNSAAEWRAFIFKSDSTKAVSKYTYIYGTSCEERL
ncbi:hypothetical protein BC830DRAFT_443574 [Chytriomyces sp. MP71]|nr:hypothetical protein BC830DRAFT_443574 [Chytriomyces sp. MP71]